MQGRSSHAHAQTFHACFSTHLNMGFVRSTSYEIKIALSPAVIVDLRERGHVRSAGRGKQQFNRISR